MIDVIKVENGKKKIVLNPGTPEDREYLKSFHGVTIKVEVISESTSILGTPVTGAL